MKFAYRLLSLVITSGFFLPLQISAATLETDSYVLHNTSQEFSPEENGLITSVVPLFYRKIKVFYEDDSYQILDTLKTQGKSKLLLKLTNDREHIIAVNPTGSQVSLLNGYTGKEIQKVYARSSGQAEVKIKRFLYQDVDFFLLATTKSNDLHSTLFKIEPTELTDVGSQLYLEGLPSNKFQLDRTRNKFTVKHQEEVQGKFQVNSEQLLTCTTTQSECMVYFWEV